MAQKMTLCNHFLWESVFLIFRPFNDPPGSREPARKLLICVDWNNKNFFPQIKSDFREKTLLQLIVNSVKCLLCGKTLHWTNKIASIKSNMRPKATLYILGKWGKWWKMMIGKRWDIIQLTIVEFGARRPFKLELSARDPGLRVTLVRVTAYDQFGLYRWWTAHSEVTSAQGSSSPPPYFGAWIQM